jgi:hypothetical protein
VVQAHQARTAPIRKKPGRRSALPNQAAQQTADHLECPAAEANGTSIILTIPATEADPRTRVSRGKPLAPLRLTTPCDEPPGQLQHVAAVLWYRYILKAFGELRER